MNNIGTTQTNRVNEEDNNRPPHMGFGNMGPGFEHNMGPMGPGFGHNMGQWGPGFGHNMGQWGPGFGHGNIFNPGFLWPLLWGLPFLQGGYGMPNNYYCPNPQDCPGYVYVNPNNQMGRYYIDPVMFYYTQQQ